ncbi:MAG: 16S rRNA (guanine(966)-N(2))-methyltransferase RsmD [Pseudomonadota bacterium]|nr:16S rRNA (guanine(966)-N(2))-methyltransferase RsmD [Pseudomonadota bacterium]
MHSTRGNKSEKAGKVRIIAGEYRGRRIAVPSRPGLRPTPDRVRETLFNWLGQWLSDLACLDLFAGSGALGFEAASRGAKRVVMVENDGEIFANLQRIRETIGATQVDLVYGDAFDFLARGEEKFDLVFLDPPFRQNALPAVLKRLPARLAVGSRVYVETDSALEVTRPWRELRKARAGRVSYQLLEWRGDDQGGVSGNV